MYKIIVTIALSFLVATPVFAHIAVQDGNVFAVLHIDPGDSPIVGQPAELHIDFTGSKEMFDVSKCNCGVAISTKDGLIMDKMTTEPGFDLDKESITLTYTFPRKAVYTITVHGFSGTTATATPFTLTYDVRVDREDASLNTSAVTDFFSHTLWHHFGHIIIFGGAFLIGGYLTYRDWKKNKEKNNSNQINNS